MKKNKILLLLALLAISFSVAAQTAAQVLGSLTFEAPKALYRAKGNTANMRQSPSTKAGKVKVYDCYDRGWWLSNAQLVADEGDNLDWVKASVEGKTVYMSKTVMTKVEPEPFMVNKCMNRPYVWETTDDPDATAGWMGQAMRWRIGKIKGQSGLYVAEVTDYDGATSLRLGKMVDNVLVFKYKVYFQGGADYQRLEGVGKWTAEKEPCEDFPYNGAKVCYFRWSNDMLFKADYDFEGGGGMMFEALDLTKLTEPMVYTIFKDEIESGRVNYFYLTSFNFTNKWQFEFM